VSVIVPEKRVGNLSGLGTILDVLGRPRRATKSSPIVTADSAMTLGAVWACIRLLADNVSGLPVDAYRRGPESRVEVNPPPPLVASPSAIVSRSTWLYQHMVSFLIRGNVYGVRTQFGADGWATKIELVHPDSMQVRQPDQLAPPEYVYNGKPIDSAKVYHVSAFNVPGSVVGLSPIKYASSTLGMGLAAEQYNYELMSGGGHPSATLTSDQVLDGPNAQTVKQRFLEGTSDGTHIAVLGAGLKYERMQLTPEEAQFLQSRNATAVDACRFFGVPPEMIGAAVQGSSLTYANREQRALDFLVFTLQWWITRIEEAWSAELPRAQYVKLNVDALLRTDAMTRAKVSDMKLRNGTRNPDEDRALEDNPPLPNGQGQEFLWPPVVVRESMAATDPNAPTDGGGN
jgi:HK97 family phage portal protein